MLPRGCGPYHHNSCKYGVQAYRAFELAQQKWTQMVWNEEESDYAIEIAEGEDMEGLQPIWPDKPFNELLKIGFDGKVTDNEDHPYVRRLRGLLD
jgi:hypothetical protein